jgi:hypothetical protein
MLMPREPTPHPLKICRRHRVVEVLPGVWNRDRFVTQPGVHSTDYQLLETACPACIAVIRALFTAPLPVPNAFSPPPFQNAA